jgi:hypothetical protein
MNLKELLAKKIQSPPKEIEEQISYLHHGRIEVDENKFLSAWSICFLSPYRDPSNRRELVRFLTSDNYYVLNTFLPISKDYLFSLYMTHYPPACPYDLHKLWLVITDMELYIPSLYQTRIGDMIREKFPLTKNSDCEKISESINHP